MVVVLNLQRVQQRQIEHVQIVKQVFTKIQILIQVLLANPALHVVVVLNLQRVQQRQIERVQIVKQVFTKIPIHIQVLHVNPALLHVVVVLHLLSVQKQ